MMKRKTPKIRDSRLHIALAVLRGQSVMYRMKVDLDSYEDDPIMYNMSMDSGLIQKLGDEAFVVDNVFAGVKHLPAWRFATPPTRQ